MFGLQKHHFIKAAVSCDLGFTLGFALSELQSNTSLSEILDHRLQAASPDLQCRPSSLSLECRDVECEEIQNDLQRYKAALDLLERSPDSSGEVKIYTSIFARGPQIIDEYYCGEPKAQIEAIFRDYGIEMAERRAPGESERYSLCISRVEDRLTKNGGIERIGVLMCGAAGSLIAESDFQDYMDLAVSDSALRIYQAPINSERDLAHAYAELDKLPQDQT